MSPSFSKMVGDGEVRVQQLIHRTRQKPMPVEMKLTAGRDQPVDHQQLQYFFPPDRFASFRETFLPELIQPQLAPQLTGQPTVSKYARVGAGSVLARRFRER